MRNLLNLFGSGEFARKNHTDSQGLLTRRRDRANCSTLRLFKPLDSYSAGSGIGRAMALLFAREGARVLAVDIQGGAAEKTAAQAAEAGDTCQAMQADVVQPDQVKSMVERAWLASPSALLTARA